VYDLLFRGGRICDGTGAPWFRADLAIKDGRIAAMGRLAPAGADQIIDVSDKYLAPGFIDIHSHSDLHLLVWPRAESKVRQGVTTEVVGQCGDSAAPTTRADIERLQRRLGWDLSQLDWSSMEDYLDLLEQRGIALNCAVVVGHGTLRAHVMGHDDRSPTSEELERMASLLDCALEAGVFGMSTGLIYAPGVFAQTDELTALARRLARRDALYFTHMRNEGARILEALEEAVSVGRDSGCRVQVSHLKVVGEDNWGSAGRVLDFIDEARSGGVDVAADQYPYTASATGLMARIPHWAHDGGHDALLRRLSEEDTRRRIRDELPADGAAWERVMISRIRGDKNRFCEGMTVQQLARHWGVDPRDAVIDLLLQEDLGVGMVAHGMCEEDVRQIMAHPAVMVGTDGSALAPTGVLGVGKPHPRSYGTFPRVMGRYVRDERVIDLERAVAKMTSLPAARLGLRDRGLLRPGFWADIVVFDRSEVRDEATYLDPHRFPRGIEYVVVNGAVVISGNEQRNVFPGRVLRHA